MKKCNLYVSKGGKTTHSPAPNWVLRTAIGSASMAGQLAVRSTGAQY